MIPVAIVVGLGLGWFLYQRAKERLIMESVFRDKLKNILSQLEPEVANLAVKLLVRAQEEGINLTITSGYRSTADQQVLYNKGRTTEGPIVTHAVPGQSWHNHRRAFDVAPLNAAGKAHWPNDIPLWNRIGRIGKSVGLKWGGDFTSFVDRPHFEYHPGLVIVNGRVVSNA